MQKLQKISFKIGFIFGKWLVFIWLNFVSEKLVLWVVLQERVFRALDLALASFLGPWVILELWLVYVFFYSTKLAALVPLPHSAPDFNHSFLQGWNPPFSEVTPLTVLSQLRMSLSLLFILSGSTLYILLTLWLDIAFIVFHFWYEEWTWNISNNYIIKSDVCIKLKNIRISLDIYQHISCRIKKKEEINISTMKTHHMPNKWQYLSCIKVSFSNQNFQNDIVTPRL